jgi:hypothetical protein
MTLTVVLSSIQKKNEDIENILQKLFVDLREIEKELFNVKIKQKVIVSPLGTLSKNG